MPKTTVTTPTFISTDVTLPASADDTGRKRPAQPGSFIAVLEALDVGDTATRCKGMNLYNLACGLPETDQLVDARRAFHNSVHPQVAKLEARSGREFKIEMTETFLSGSARLFIVAFVTRIA